MCKALGLCSCMERNKRIGERERRKEGKKGMEGGKERREWKGKGVGKDRESREEREKHGLGWRQLTRLGVCLIMHTVQV